MPITPPGPDQFWLLTGTIPAGPFSIAQIHAELVAGRATWETPACAVGGTVWQPLMKISGFGPEAEVARREAEPAQSGPGAATGPAPPTYPPAASIPAAPPTAAQPDPPSRENPSPSRREMAIGVGILGILLATLGAVGYGIYEWVRPHTATEVCRKFNEAKTAAEARKLATPRMHPLIDAIYADPTAFDPNDAYALTTEIDGLRANTKLVGFSGTTFIPEAGQRVRMEGHFVLIKSDGWKIDDVILTGVEGASLPGPVSLIDEHHRSAFSTRPATPAKPGAWSLKTGSTLVLPKSTPRVKSKLEKGFEEVKEAIGWGGIVVVVIVIAVVVAIREAAREKART